MTVNVLHLATLSVKIALLGGLASGQLYLLRRAPASSRSRLCSLALIAILLLGAGEMLAPHWTVQGPVFLLSASSAVAASPAATRATVGSWLTLLWMMGAAFMLLRAVVGRTAIRN